MKLLGPRIQDGNAGLDGFQERPAPVLACNLVLADREFQCLVVDDEFAPIRRDLILVRN